MKKFFVILLSVLCVGCIAFGLYGCNTKESDKSGTKIVSVIKTSADSNGDTYTITFEDGMTTTFTISDDNKDDKEEKSAYDIYKEKYGYDGTEEEWLYDLANDNLSFKRKYIVTFDTDGGSFVEKQKVDDGGKIVKPDIPVKNGYEFDGWFYEDEEWNFVGYVVTENITLTAKWKLLTFKIKYETYGGVNSELNPAEYTAETERITLRTPVKGNSTFEGWFTEDTFENEVKTIEKGSYGDKKFYAKWSAEKYSEGLEFTRRGNSYSVSGIGICTDKDLIIPPTNEGLPVFQIDFMAFATSTKINSVVIPDSVLRIEDSVFSSITGLTSVVIGKKVQFIGSFAFSNCKNLKNIRIPDSVTEIDIYAFSECGLTNVKIGNGLKKIESSTFSNCSNLTSITIGEEVTSIERNAFYSCTNLSGINIPAKVESIDTEAFFNCSSFERITVDKNNTKYYSDGNCLIEKDYNRLILGCKNSIIPSDIKIIGSYAFYGCKGLTSITIPESVIYINYAAFQYCSDLSVIKFDITVAELKELSLSSAVFNYSKVTEIVCTDGNVLLSEL